MTKFFLFGLILVVNVFIEKGGKKVVTKEALKRSAWYKDSAGYEYQIESISRRTIYVKMSTEWSFAEKREFIALYTKIEGGGGKKEFNPIFESWVKL